mmetsp:Transcript_39506/g.62725  ORF Transcript_39506/g.62725 Transcript_39506/m.62725 type:complete len:256 (-) Transcript_39506:55-822(-)
MTLSCGVLFILCAHDVYAATLAEDLLRLPLQRLPLVRRHTEEQAAQLLPTGVVTSIRTDQKNDEWEYCNHEFVVNPVEENACPAGKAIRQIDHPDDCEHAAQDLGFVWGGVYQNPDNIPGNRLPIPHNCFKNKDDDKVYYNGETLNPPENLRGWMICEEEKFPYALDDGSCPSPDDFELIGNDVAECEKAFQCKLGNRGCKDHPTMVWHNGAVESNRVAGCYVDINECFRYNAGTAASVTPSVAGDRAVCKVKVA